MVLYHMHGKAKSMWWKNKETNKNFKICSVDTFNCIQVTVQTIIDRCDCRYRQNNIGILPSDCVCRQTWMHFNYFSKDIQSGYVHIVYCALCINVQFIRSEYRYILDPGFQAPIIIIWILFFSVEILKIEQQLLSIVRNTKCVIRKSAFRNHEKGKNSLGKSLSSEFQHLDSSKRAKFKCVALKKEKRTSSKQKEEMELIRKPI